MGKNRLEYGVYVAWSIAVAVILKSLPPDIINSNSILIIVLIVIVVLPLAITLWLIDKANPPKDFFKEPQDPYNKIEPWATALKAYAQMFIGFTLFMALITRPFLITISPELDDSVYILKETPLRIVGEALAISAGIELAYMLFTPGPDEAVEPLILGFASAILLLISENDTLKDNTWQLALVILVFAMVLGFLFYLKREFILDEKSVDVTPVLYIENIVDTSFFENLGFNIFLPEHVKGQQPDYLVAQHGSTKIKLIEDPATQAMPSVQIDIPVVRFDLWYGRHQNNPVLQSTTLIKLSDGRKEMIVSDPSGNRFRFVGK